MSEQIDLGIDNIIDAQEIGRGGFSIVYGATNSLLGTRVAVKVLGTLSADSDQRRFERECQVMGRLSRHPNVVTVHHAGYTSENAPYLIMELVGGGSLADRLDRSGSLRWPEAIDHVVPIAEALAYVHDAGILHRDVKPENILIGSEGQPLLTDFGIARLGDGGGTNTSTGIAASWLHAPPETFDNLREPRSDLYSLASTLHQAIAGRPPFWRSDEDSLNPLMRRLLEEPPPILGPELAPAALADLVQRSLAKAPAARPADLRIFAAELTAIRAAASGGVVHVPTQVAPSAGFDPNARAAAAAAPEWFGPDSQTVSADAPLGRSAQSDRLTVSADAAPLPVPRQPSSAPGLPSSQARSRGVLIGVSVMLALLVLAGGVYALTRTGSPGGDEPAGSEPSDELTSSLTSEQAVTDPTSDSTSPPSTPAVVGGDPGGRLATVQERGSLNCGVNDSLPGFGLLDVDGSYSGFDIDFCRVVAAAVLGDAQAVNFVPLTSAERFTALQAGEIDVLFRNTTQTATRAGENGAEFPFTTYFDGQSVMAHSDAGISTLDDLDGKVVCVVAGTTTEFNLVNLAESRGLAISPLTFESNDQLSLAYENGQCDAWTGDITLLASFRRVLASPNDHVIVPELITSEPLGPAVLADDGEWSTAVQWAVMATVQAWEAGIDSSNVNTYTGSDLTALRITGQDETFDPGFGLQPGYTRLVIDQVGNYQEIYDRNLGDSGLPLSGSANDLVANGGQMFAPPLR